MGRDLAPTNHAALVLLCSALLCLAIPAVVAEGTGKGCYVNSQGVNTACCWSNPTSSCPACPRNAADVSPAFGCWGGFFNAGKNRMPYDWSYAGYRMGEKVLPSVKIVADIKKDFGAKGDGKTDDSAAFMRAFAEVSAGGVYLPAGTYVITRVLQTFKGSLVLVGAGRDKTTLYFPKSLTDIYGNKYMEGGGCCSSDFSHSSAFIQYLGGDIISGGGYDKTWLGKIVADANMGDNVIKLDRTYNVKKGMLIRIHTADPGDNSATNAMLGYYKGFTAAPKAKILGSYGTTRFFTRVTAVGSNYITLERNLPFPIKAKWGSEVHKTNWRLQEAGIQDLTIKFPLKPYPGHLKEIGYNAIFFKQAANSFIRRVRILNSDSGFYSWGSNFITVRDIEVGTTGDRGKEGAGHRAIWLEHGAEALVTKFRINGIYKHDLSTSSFEQGSVFSDGWGLDLDIDWHRSAPYGNLYTNLDFGKGTRCFMSSGDPNNGAHAGAYNTVWNVSASSAPGRAIKYPYTGTYRWQEDATGPLLNFYGLKGGQVRKPMPYGWTAETFNNKGLIPANLHLGLLTRRRGLAAAKAIASVPKPHHGKQGGQGHKKHQGQQQEQVDSQQ